MTAIHLAGRDFLTLNDFRKEEIHYILHLASDLKAKLKQGEYPLLLKGKTLAMIFEKSSTRTRVSFEVGMTQLGGTALFLSKDDIQLGRGESIFDTANVLSRYVDAIMIRTFSQKTVEQFAQHATIPIINGLTDLYHPCQVLADLLTIQEKKGFLTGLKVAYIGDGNNMAHSLLVGCATLGINIAVATPPKYEPNESIVKEAKRFAEKESSIVNVTHNTLDAIKNADVVYTDVWASMGQEQEQNERAQVFKSFQVNSELMEHAKEDAIFMHCLPAHRGEEVTSDVIDGPQSVIFDQAENRLHAQKGLLVALLSDL